MSRAAREAAIKLIRAQDIDLAKLLYISTAGNRVNNWFSNYTAYRDYKDYAYYRWRFRGELPYEPVVHNYTAEEYDRILIEMMYASGKMNHGFRRYVHSVWDREDPNPYAWANQNTMNFIRWSTRER